MAHLEALNHHNQVLQLEPLEVWHQRGIGIGSGVYSVHTCTSDTHNNVIYLFFSYYGFYFSLWLKPCLLFQVDDQVEYLQDLMD